MAQPPSTKKIVSSDLEDDWAAAKDTLLPPVNKFLSDVNDSLSGGLRLEANLGCQVWSFRIQTPPEWTEIPDSSLLNSWVKSSATEKPAYCVLSNGDVRFRGKIKSGTIGLPAYILPTALWPEIDVNVATISNGAFSAISVFSGLGYVIPAVGSNLGVSLDFTYRPILTSWQAPKSCFPVRTKCTLPGGQALKVELGQIIDVTPNSKPVLHGASQAVWHNDSGYISIDNILGLIGGRTYQITAIAYPK